MPPGTRHGSAFEVPADVAAALLARDAAGSPAGSTR
jgi:hypothetical protein